MVFSILAFWFFFMIPITPCQVVFEVTKSFGLALETEKHQIVA